MRVKIVTKRVILRLRYCSNPVSWLFGLPLLLKSLRNGEFVALKKLKMDSWQQGKFVVLLYLLMISLVVVKFVLCIFVCVQKTAIMIGNSFLVEYGPFL